MKHLYLDIETIPGQQPAFREEIAAKFLAHHQPIADQLLAQSKNLKPPGNITKAETIAAWEKEKKPGAIADLEARAAAELEMAKAKTEDEWRRSSFDGAAGQIVVIGFAFDEAAPVTLFNVANPAKSPIPTLADEASVLSAFFKALRAVKQSEELGVIWVGHNVLDFDLRFIFQRAVIHGIRPPSWIPFQAKPWGDRVFDTMTAWAGARNRISQDKLCRALGIAGKGAELGDEIDGSKVWDFVKEGKLAQVATYCGGDVERAREIHKRLTFA